MTDKDLSEINDDFQEILVPSKVKKNTKSDEVFGRLCYRLWHDTFCMLCCKIFNTMNAILPDFAVRMADFSLDFIFIAHFPQDLHRERCRPTER